jgi:uncharacterized protein
MAAVPHVVLDTNVLISAAGWNGPPRALFQACRDGRLQLVTSLVLLDELKRVLAYPKLKFTKQDIETFEQSVLTCAYVVEPKREIAACRDRDDDRVLECAVEGDVTMIVTGDPDLRVLSAFESIPIRLAKEAVEHFSIVKNL